MHYIEHLRLISLQTVTKPFATKISPILAHGLEQIWDHLTANDLTILENVKATYLKRALRLSRFTAFRLVYTMAREPFLIEKLRNGLLLTSIESFETLLNTSRKSGRIYRSSGRK
jgi:hypothetical protein